MAPRKRTTGRSLPNEADRHVAARVKSRRLQLGMSQSELGRKIGITFQQIQKYEKGTNRIGSGRLLQIATVLAVPASYFFDDPLIEMGGGGGMKVDVFDQFCASKDGTSLMQAFIKIKSKPTRHAIVALVTELEE